MTQPFRLAAGGRVDRRRALRFTFDGREYPGHPGDTLASALLANGVRTVATSVEHGRPRGIFSAGAEEPNALVQVESGSCSEPMLKATQVELYDGLRARGLPGRGTVPTTDDPARYDRMFRHCDVAVVGGGPAGLAAAQAATRAGARVVLVDDGQELGGCLLGLPPAAAGPALDWLGAVAGELAAAAETLVLTRSTAVGYYDGNYLTVVENRTDHLGPAAPARWSRQRLWHLRAAQVVLATGAHERPLVFADNDRPGVMLATAARTYVNRYGVRPGGRAVVATDNDSAYPAALDLLDAGVEVALVVDLRSAAAPGPAAGELRRRGVDVRAGWVVAGTGGPETLTSVTVAPRGGGGSEAVGADLLAVSGGWNPALHLFGQSGGRVRYEPATACFVPDVSAAAERSAGAARGTMSLSGSLREGAEAGSAAAVRAGFPVAADTSALPAVAEPAAAPIEPAWVTPAEDGSWDRHYLDLQRDATVAGVLRATGAGMRSVEHVKRYTTIGTGNDQGKTSGISTVGVLAGILGMPLADLGPTTFRPPYAPVSFGLLAGRDRGRLSDPVRTTPIHSWHVEHGAVFEDVGQWQRPRYFPVDGEDIDAAVRRECVAARTGVAVMDASTLGKIDIRGPDAPEFLDRIYTNAFARLPVGSCRYGVMCRTDGMVFDDGVTMRLADDRFLMSTTTGNAAAVLDWLEEWLQTEWPGLRVYATSVTEQWATVAVVGPLAREVLGRLCTDIPLDATGFPFMTWRSGTVAGIAARVARISFSGELAYEVNVAGWYGRALWEAVMAAGAGHGITPYGTETMHVLRAEKGFVIVGQDTDGTVTPQDAGLGWAVSRAKDFVGRRSFARPDTARADRKVLVGLLPERRDEVLPEGAALVGAPVPAQSAPYAPVVPLLGHVTSSYYSPVLRRAFALALVKGGRDRIGDTVYAPLVDRTVAVTVTEPVFYDPGGDRRDG